MSETPPTRVLVVGGTGHYGQHIVRSLAQRGATVRVLSRNAASARLLLGEPPEIVRGDITSEMARRTALQLLNRFPAEIAAEAPQAHRLLLETFNYPPTTLDMEARRRTLNRRIR